jgi:hypothetical protein
MICHPLDFLPILNISEERGVSNRRFSILRIEKKSPSIAGGAFKEKNLL